MPNSLELHGEGLDQRQRLGARGRLYPPVQGYDLNYAGVIIGKDLRYDSQLGNNYFDRSHYHDKKGRENNPKLGITYSDSDLLRYVQNIYSVLLTRGILGTYVYVCDAPLREHLRRYFSA